MQKYGNGITENAWFWEKLVYTLDITYGYLTVHTSIHAQLGNIYAMK